MCPPAVATSRSTPRCPATGRTGRPVAGETVRSLVVDTSRADLSGSWHYCGVQDCVVVYFDADEHTIEKSELKVRVGEKERDPPHTVCYCFGHTVEEIREDIVRHGRTTVPDSIKARVKAGECSCEVSNPTGTCCLGDVAREVGRAEKQLAVAMPGGETRGEATCSAGPKEDATCCDPANPSEADTNERGAGRTTLAALGLSCLTAIGASACCWLPLLLVAAGASSAGVAAMFDGLRPALVVVAPLLIGFSFYLIYLRRARCVEGSGCEVRRGNKSHSVRAFFWVAVALLAFSIAFPSAMSALLGGTGPTRVERLARLPYVELRISGMTCESCSAGVRTALLDVGGVVDAAADHERGSARVWYEPASRPREADLRAAVERQGYEVEAIGAHGHSRTQERRVPGPPVGPSRSGVSKSHAVLRIGEPPAHGHRGNPTPPCSGPTRNGPLPRPARSSAGARDTHDPDGDSRPNAEDFDDDGDGIPDSAGPFPCDPDHDNDGHADGSDPMLHLASNRRLAAS